MAAVLYAVFALLGFMSPVFVDLWAEVLALFMLLAISITPVSIPVYFFNYRRITATRDKIVLIAVDVLFYAAALVVPLGLYFPVFPVALWILAPMGVISFGLLLQRSGFRVRAT